MSLCNISTLSQLEERAIIRAVRTPNYKPITYIAVHSQFIVSQLLYIAVHSQFIVSQLLYIAVHSRFIVSQLLILQWIGILKYRVRIVFDVRTLMYYCGRL